MVSATDGSVSASYAWDARGHRKTKTVGSTTTHYITDADNREILEYDGSTGQILRWYVYGLGIDDALNQVELSGDRQTLIPDIQGSVVASLSSTSGTLTRTGYRVFGESATTTGSYRYTGRRIDAETGGLYYYRARMYSPTLGRFLQPDPIGYEGGSNLYAYVGNDPLNFVDPSGLVANQAVAALGSGIAALNAPATDPVSRSACGGNLACMAYQANLTGDPGFYKAPYTYGELLEVAAVVAPLASAGTGAARGVTATARGTSVLGHASDGYVSVAKTIGARYFNVPTKVWDAMTPAQQWAANAKFLDRLIARGDTVVLATQASAARAGSFFARELEYLSARGYTLAEDGMRMLPRR